MQHYPLPSPPINRIVAHGGPFILGSMMVLGFAPFSFSLLGILAPAMLLMRLHYMNSQRAAWRLGLFFGLGLYGCGVSWVYISMTEYSQTPDFIALGLVLLFVAYCAMYKGLTLLGTFMLYQRLKVPYIVSFPVLWLGGEWLLSTVFTGFPWLLIGYSQSYSPLAALAPVLGIWGVSFISLVLASILVIILLNGQLKYWWPGLGVIAMSTLLCTDITWVEPQRYLSTALVQGNVHQSDRWDPLKRPLIYQNYVELTRHALGAELIVWPETALPLFLHEALPLFESLNAKLAPFQSTLLIGLPVREENQLYNGLVNTQHPTQPYFKRHLVPFGEYVPFESVLRNLIDFFNLPMSHFSSSTEATLLHVNEITIAPMICYEIAFPELIRSTIEDAGIIVNVSNDAWFGQSIGPYQHRQIAQFRAMEAQRPILRATNTGQTVIINYKGRLQAELASDTPGVLKGSVQTTKGLTPYMQWGNGPLALIIGIWLLYASLCSGAWSWLREKRTRRYGTQDMPLSVSE